MAASHPARPEPALPPHGQVFATITGVDAVHPAAIRQLFEAAEIDVDAGTDTELAEQLGGVAPLSSYLTFALPAWREAGQPLRDGRLPPLPYHEVSAQYGERAIATSVTVIAGEQAIRFGDRITSRWRVQSVAPRTTRLGAGVELTFVVDFSNQHGEALATEYTTIVVFGSGDRADTAASSVKALPLPVPAAFGSGPDFDARSPCIGQRLSPVRLTMPLQRLVMIAAANRDFAPVHHDPHAAAEIGAPAPIVNSMFLLTLAERVAHQMIGTPMFGGQGRVVRLGPLRMLRPTPAGTTLRCIGQVSDVSGDEHERRVVAELLVEVDSGGMTAKCEIEIVLTPERSSVYS